MSNITFPAQIKKIKVITVLYIDVRSYSLISWPETLRNDTVLSTGLILKAQLTYF